MIHTSFSNQQPLSMKLNFRFEYIMNKHKLASVLKVRIEFPVSHGRQSFLPRKVYRYAKYSLIRNIFCNLIDIWYKHFLFLLFLFYGSQTICLIFKSKICTQVPTKFLFFQSYSPIEFRRKPNPTHTRRFFRVIPLGTHGYPPSMGTHPKFLI